MGESCNDDALGHGRYGTIWLWTRAPECIGASKDEGSSAPPGGTTVELEVKASVWLWARLRTEDVRE